MLGSIAGDIIGSRFEGQAGPPRDFALFHPACRFTDDTVCGPAVAEARPCALAVAPAENQSWPRSKG